MRRLLGAACAVALLSASAAAADCLKANEDQVAQGLLRSARISIPAYGLKEQAYFVMLRTPACLDGKDEYDNVEKAGRIHVYSMDQALRRKMGRLVGKQVRVRGQPFGQHTAHHHAPIVMQIQAIDPI